MIRAGGAIPGDWRGKFTRAAVEKQDDTAFGGNDIEQQREELPLQRVNISHGADGGADLEKSRESTRKPNGRRKRRKRFGPQIEKVLRLKLLGRET